MRRNLNCRSPVREEVKAAERREFWQTVTAGEDGMDSD